MTAEEFLEREGYRRCDIAACNCGSWHRQTLSPSQPVDPRVDTRERAECGCSCCLLVCNCEAHHGPRFDKGKRPLGGAALGVADASGEIRGVAIVGRPVARMLDDGLTLEVTRVATDGCKDACSSLYGAARRATFALGYKKLVTYTLPSESGASLRAAGYRCIGEAGGGEWGREGRPRVDKHPTQTKLRWEAA